MIEPLRELLPVARPGDAEEIIRQWIERYATPRPVDAQTKLWNDHFSSVREFRAWKAEHPNDGTMTVLYHWAPYIAVAVSVVTFNPILLGAAFGMMAMRKSRVPPG